MPEVDGLELLRFVRSNEELSNLPVISEWPACCQCMMVLLHIMDIIIDCIQSKLQGNCMIFSPASDMMQQCRCAESRCAWCKCTHTERSLTDRQPVPACCSDVCK